MVKIEFILLVRALIGLEKDTLMAASSFSKREMKGSNGSVGDGRRGQACLPHDRQPAPPEGQHHRGRPHRHHDPLALRLCPRLAHRSG